MDILSGFITSGSQGIRSLARNLFSGFYERGIGANQALNELRSLGLGYRRQDFLRDYREGRGDYDTKTAVRYVQPLNYPSDNILKPTYHGVPDKYSFVFKYQGTDPDTGEGFEGYFFYHRQTIDRKANMENDAYDYVSSNADKYGYNVESVEVVEGYINPVWKKYV